MTARPTRAKLALALLTATLVVLTCASVAQAVPVKEILTSHFGWRVDQTTGANVCTVESKDVCQRGAQSSEPGGFTGARDVAVDNDAADSAHFGHVFVADSSNNRVQELTAAGAFVAMFGWDVNKTKVEAGGASTQEEKNVCTEEEIKGSGVICQAGEEGPDPEKLAFPVSIAVDPADGNVYVGEVVNHRVDAYTPAGHLLWTTGGFNDPSEAAVLAAGGPEQLLYVGSEGHVLELEANGKPKRELTVAGVVTAIAVGASSGDIYVMYSNTAAVHVLNPSGTQIAEFPIAPSEAGAGVEETRSLALDSAGHLAVNAREQGPNVNRWFGSLLDASSGHLITQFSGEDAGLAFGPNDELYAAAPFNSIAETGEEVLAFTAHPVAELLTSPSSCAAGVEAETDATFNCTLKGTVNPEGVEETEAWFRWGRTCASVSETSPQPIATGESPVPVSALIEGLRPHEPLCYQLAAHDKFVLPPERLSSEQALFTTPSAPPRVLGTPSASFVKAFSVVLFGELNPENAPTAYAFAYWPCAQPESVGFTSLLESSTYGLIGATLEATGLQPATTYCDALIAENEAEQVGESEEAGEFTTAPAPAPQAATGPASAVTATSALISGSVNPNGQPATFAFELGVYNGAGTQYGVVLSGSAGAGSAPVQETLPLSGLQPGTTYAYRIKVASGFGTATGEAATFTTQGLPSVLSAPTPLALLAVPPIAFPPEAPAPKPSPKCRRGYKLGKHHRCVKAKRKAKRRGKGAHRKKK